MTSTTVPEFQHRTVLLDEAVDALALDGARAVQRQRIDRFVKQHRAMLKFRHRCGCHHGTLEREIGEYIGGAGFNRLLLFFRLFGGIPDFEVGAHAHHHHFAFEADGGPQFRRNEDAAGRVHFDVGGVTEEDPLPRAGLHRPLGNLLTVLFPHRAGEQHDAAIGMAGQGEAAFALDRERVTMLGGDGHPAFCIEIDCGRALKHGITF